MGHGAGQGAERRRVVSTAIDGLRASRLERAPRDPGDQTRRLTGNRREATSRQIGARNRLQQSSRVRVGWLAEQGPARRHFHGPACVHHDHLVGHFSDDAEVVRDQDDRRAEFPLHAAEQPDDLRLHRHVEGRGRLVGHQQARIERQRQRDHRALQHAAGELVRVVVDAAMRMRNADQPQKLDGPRARLRLRDRFVCLNHLHDLPPDAIQRMETRQRILEHHRDARAAHGPQLVGRHRQQILPLEQRLAGHPRPPRQPHHRLRGDALSGSGFADDAEHLAAGN